MIVDSVLINAKAYLNGQIVDCSIAIEEGKILKIGRETQMPNADQKVNLSGLLVLPGLIDEHVHLRDESKEYKEDFFSGTAAAAAGGFTTVLDMPNNEPVTMSVGTLRNRMGIAARRVLVNVGLYSEFPRKVAEVEDIVSEGAVGFKLFMGSQIGGLDIDEDDDLLEAFKLVAPLKVPIAIHAEDKAMLNDNEEKLKRINRVDIAAFGQAHTEAVETKAIERVLKISQPIDMRLHFCHVSTKAGLATISKGKAASKKVTCEVTPNHLLLTEADLTRYGQMVIMAPPLRDKGNAEELWKGVEDGSVDTIGSDHAPHALSEKEAANIWDVKVGVPGLETTLPLMFTQVKKNRISIQQLVSLLAEKPAEIYGLKDRGRLEKDMIADMTVLDYNQKFKVDASKFKSKAKFSPYNGWEVVGKPVKTFVNGLLVFDDGEIVAKAGSGLIVRGDNA